MEIFERDKQILIRLKQLCDLNGMEENIDYVFNNENYSITINDKNGRGVWIGAAVDEKTNLGQIFVDGDFGKEDSVPLRFSFIDTTEWEEMSSEQQELEIQDRLFSILLQEHMLLSTGHNHIRDFVVVNRISEFQFPIITKEEDALKKAKDYFDESVYMHSFAEAYKQELEKQPSIKHQDEVFVADIVKEYSFLQTIKNIQKSLEENPDNKEIKVAISRFLAEASLIKEKDKHDEVPKDTLAIKNLLLNPDGISSTATKMISLGGIFAENAKNFINDMKEWYTQKNSDFYKNWDKLKAKIEIFVDNIKEHAFEAKENTFDAFKTIKEYLSDKYISTIEEIKSRNAEHQKKYLEKTLDRLNDKIDKLEDKKREKEDPYLKDLQHIYDVLEKAQKEKEALNKQYNETKKELKDNFNEKWSVIIHKKEEIKENKIQRKEEIKEANKKIDQKATNKINKLEEKTNEQIEIIKAKAEKTRDAYFNKRLEEFIKKTYGVHLSKSGVEKVKEELINKGWNKEDFKLTTFEQKRLDSYSKETQKKQEQLKKEISKIQNEVSKEKEKNAREVKKQYFSEIEKAEEKVSRDQRKLSKEENHEKEKISSKHEKEEYKIDKKASKDVLKTDKWYMGVSTNNFTNNYENIIDSKVKKIENSINKSVEKIKNKIKETEEKLSDIRERGYVTR